MYAEFYGLRADPFHVTPDATLIFLTKAHREAIGVLEYGLRVRKGFVVLTGEVGVGKTTMLRHSLRRLDPATSAIVYVLQPSLTPHQLVSFIWEELTGEIDPVQQPWASDTGELIRRLLFRLKTLHDSGKLIVIVIDEAQNMPVETLESLRLLSNLESDKQKFLQIVLAGQPELDEKLARHELRQLNQRIAVRTRIGNLSTVEALAYIQYRLDIAAGRHLKIFTPSALAYIVAAAAGNPRRLNIFCDNALINGMGHRAAVVTREIAAEAIAPHLGRQRPGAGMLPAWLRDSVPRALPVRYAALGMGAVIAFGLAVGLGTDLVSGEAAPRPVAWHARHDETLIATLPREDQPIADVTPLAPAPTTAKPIVTVAVANIAKPAPPAPLPVTSYRVETQETLDELCKLSYGICGANMLRALALANPTIDPLHLIAGEIVYLPVIENLTPAVP